MRDEAFVRCEIRWLVERARVALGLPASAAVGCTEEQIDQVLEAQQISALPPPLDELLRVAGIHARGNVLGELLPASGAGWDVMLFAKDHARKTAAISGSKETFDALKERLGGSVEVLTPELDARIHAGEKVVDGKLPGSWPKLQTTPDVRLSAGDRVGSLEVVASPGHTPGHVAFLDTRDGTLIGGDVFTTYGGAAASDHFHLRFPFAAMATWDKAKDLESARALRALDPAVLAVGHGPAMRDPGAAMDAAIARAAS